MQNMNSWIFSPIVKANNFLLPTLNNTFKYISSKRFVYHPPTMKISVKMKTGLKCLSRKKPLLSSDDTGRKQSKDIECVLLTHSTTLQVNCYTDLQEAEYETERTVRLSKLGLISPLSLLKLKLSQLIVYSSISPKMEKDTSLFLLFLPS